MRDAMQVHLDRPDVEGGEMRGVAKDNRVRHEVYARVTEVQPAGALRAIGHDVDEADPGCVRKDGAQTVRQFVVVT